ncbi:uncharacterized protein MYCFIDRAFT_211869 [Pseudocercospora fijiensis CIRAD86]|uniref:Uncharacterized protein n=1 Tax=Pseudocercospora fijiensis (strain CIRAD86) TaxID=383855 RepID=M3AA85_PSEFD|nr:uncharacterized protein MYCFIDRAFT_211869 [Pseudocercospora fijiensis CIRAD86]EME81531.1 hypothetical protein MYCFIDRAFT_211869 [Pseudocercospora fijiensis CIRAD86]
MRSMRSMKTGLDSWDDMSFRDTWTLIIILRLEQCFKSAEDVLQARNLDGIGSKLPSTKALNKALTAIELLIAISWASACGLIQSVSEAWTPCPRRSHRREAGETALSIT